MMYVNILKLRKKIR